MSGGLVINPREQPKGVSETEKDSQFLGVVRKQIQRRKKKGGDPPTVRVIVQVRADPKTLDQYRARIAAGLQKMHEAGIEDDEEGMAFLGEEVEQDHSNRWYDVEIYWSGEATWNMEEMERPHPDYLREKAREVGAKEARTAIRMQT